MLRFVSVDNRGGASMATERWNSPVKVGFEGADARTVNGPFDALKCWRISGRVCVDFVISRPAAPAGRRSTGARAWKKQEPSFWPPPKRRS